MSFFTFSYPSFPILSANSDTDNLKRNTSAFQLLLQKCKKKMNGIDTNGFDCVYTQLPACMQDCGCDTVAFGYNLICF
ncbi:hypothetical protein CFP56_021077 [Quercus suber]|uniref:Uncharacterized protein n=1 Tax=Quercus suber TaxID=58331 RepID=A0AAW0KE32_QUESU